MMQGKSGVRGGSGVCRFAWVMGVLAAAACGRDVDVNDGAKDTPSPSQPSDAASNDPGKADGGKTNLLDGIDQNQADAAPTQADASGANPRDGAGVVVDAGGIVDARPSVDTTKPTDADVAPTPDAGALKDATPVVDATSPVDTASQKDAASGAVITGVEILTDGLSAISVPAVGTDGVSILQYTSAGTAMALHVSWDRVVGRWYENSGARCIYLAASGTRHAGLLYLASTYPIQADGTATELSGTPTTYKEFLAANDAGYAWVDYVQSGGGGRAGGGSSTTSLGAVVFKTWQGTRTNLTDNLRYRARPDISSTRAVYVEYANTTSGTPGQIMVQPLTGGAAAAVATSSHHQDRPAVDGNWVVWEEYLSSTDVVIRAKNVATNEVRDLSSKVGFRTNPDVRGTRVVWEDQRSGNSDIYTYDLAGNKGEQVAVSGTGYSTGARLTSDGLVWTEANGNNIGLVRARWAL